MRTSKRRVEKRHIVALNEEKLDRGIPVPLYYQLKEILLKHIERHEMKTGEPIPSEAELMNMFNISRPTVRQAVTELVNLGYLKKVRGKGTFVAKPKIKQEFTQRIISFNEEMLLKGLTPSTTVLEARCIPADEAIGERLQLESKAEVFHLKRLRFIDDEPIVVADSFIPIDRFPGLEKVDFANKSLYGVFNEKYKTRIKRVVRSIEVMVAGTQDARLLNTEKDQDPVHFFESIAFDQSDVPVEYTISRYRGDRSKFVIEIVQEI